MRFLRQGACGSYSARSRPAPSPIRFDARFFLADVSAVRGDPEDLAGASGELLDLNWIPVDRAIEYPDLPYITRVVLREARERWASPDDADHRVPFFAEGRLSAGTGIPLMQNAVPSTFGAWFGVVASIAYISTLGLGYGMAYPLLTVILEFQGVTGALIGASFMAQAFGAIVITVFMPGLLRRWGLPRMLVTTCVIEILAFLALHLWRDPWIWMPLRAILGATGSVAFYGSEYWIVSVAPRGRRGTVVAAYGVVIALALSLGPLLLNAIGFEGFLPFAAAMLTGAIAIVPVVLARRHAPRFRDTGNLAEVPRFMISHPVLCGAVVLFGLLEASLLGLLPSWGVRAGLDATAAVTLVAVAGFGVVALLPVIGPACERLNRSLILATCTFGCAALMLAMPVLVDARYGLWAAGVPLGRPFRRSLHGCARRIGRPFRGTGARRWERGGDLELRGRLGCGSTCCGDRDGPRSPRTVCYMLRRSPCAAYLALLIRRRGMPRA